MKPLRSSIILLVLLAAVTIVLAEQQKEHGGRPLTAQLTGAAEVPGPGDADGAGTFSVTLNPGQNQICYELAVSNIATATAAHIHTGAADVAGPVLVTLKTPSDGPVKECVELDREKIKLIMQKPGDYYVNVHNAEFPAGAVRGQLTK
ncbi:MAG TPA: CHRD domain-containing protein [Pyrinomonadaceae bacterium]|nr:CHRD domain-containing protein [Pyrinomonadaceae bacterium]